MKRHFVNLFALLLMWFSHCVLAGNLKLSPLLLNISHQNPASTLTIKNDSDESTAIQANVFRWVQEKGIDHQLAQSDISISPSFMTLSPHQSQTLHLTWKKKRPLDTQLSYRVILKEIPPDDAASKTIFSESLKLFLAFSIPLFIQPSVKHPSFQWHAKWLDKNTLKLSFNNSGNMTLFLNEIRLLSNKGILVDKSTFNYVLPKQQQSWVLTLDKRTSFRISAMINGERKVTGFGQDG